MIKRTSFFLTQITLSIILLLSECGSALAQQFSLPYYIDLLCSESCQGRGSGTSGSVDASWRIARHFKASGMLPLHKEGWFQCYDNGKEGAGHNVMGLLPGSKNISPREKYLIVSAHYDGLGVIGGNVYPGADSNASGVAFMMNLARRLYLLRMTGQMFLGHSIIFVAMDARDPSLEGAKVMLAAIKAGKLRDPRNQMPVSLSQIEGFVNLDIVGSTLEPVHKGRNDYLIMLSSDKATETPQRWKSTLTRVNLTTAIGLDLSFDYYGSKDFTRLFYRRIGDQRIFLEAGIPAVVFTSGITMQTNKTTDSPQNLDYPVMESRCELIFNWLVAILSTQK